MLNCKVSFLPRLQKYSAKFNEFEMSNHVILKTLDAEWTNEVYDNKQCYINK